MDVTHALDWQAHLDELNLCCRFVFYIREHLRAHEYKCAIFVVVVVVVAIMGEVVVVVVVACRLSRWLLSLVLCSSLVPSGSHLAAHTYFVLPWASTICIEEIKSTTSFVNALSATCDEVYGTPIVVAATQS